MRIAGSLLRCSTGVSIRKYLLIINYTMKHHFLLKNLLPWVGGLLVLTACQKEVDADKQVPLKDTYEGVRITGAIADDSARVAKVPTIVSRPYIMAKEKEYLALMAASRKGRPIKGGTDGGTTPPPTSTGDTVAPTVNILSPENGSTVSGTISINVQATDNIGVSKVVLSVDGNVIGSISSTPYTFTWNASSVSDGLHTLTATASDTSGNTGAYSIVITKNTSTVVLPPPPTDLPSSFQLNMPPVGQQGGEGSCVSFAVAYAARSCEQYYRSNATGYSYSTNIFSPEFVFNQTKIGSGCSGSALLDALDLIVRNGVCTWASMPYSYTDGCSLLPSSVQNTEAGAYKISSYSKVYSSDIAAVKSMIVNKHPLMMYFANDANFNNAGPGYIWKSYATTGGYGTHAITICGYDDSRRAFKAINSWGTGWGEGGYIWIDYDFLPSVASTLYVMN